jgi:hypothetical protein
MFSLELQAEQEDRDLLILMSVQIEEPRDWTTVSRC